MFCCVCLFIVLDEPFELLRVVGTAVVGGPGVADGEFMELQHIHHPDLRHHTAKQVWTLVHARRCVCILNLLTYTFTQTHMHPLSFTL